MHNILFLVLRSHTAPTRASALSARLFSTSEPPIKEVSQTEFDSTAVHAILQEQQTAHLNQDKPLTANKEFHSVCNNDNDLVSKKYLL